MEHKKLIYFSIFNVAIVILAIFIIRSDLPDEQAVIYERYAQSKSSSTSNSELEVIKQIDDNHSQGSKHTTSKTSDNKTIQTSISSNTTSQTTTLSLPLNLNFATLEQLTQLNGIGETLAQRIIDYRNSIGAFVNRSELLNVSGIGEKKLSAIYNDIYIENEQPIAQVTEEQQVIEDDIYIPKEPEQPQEQPVSEETSQDVIIYVNLNTATVDDLLTIPDMDIETAQKIIDLRTQIQYFSHIYELLYVDGINENRLSAMQEYIYVE